jgi:hypothetical protein
MHSLPRSLEKVLYLGKPQVEHFSLPALIHNFSYSNPATPNYLFLTQLRHLAEKIAKPLDRERRGNFASHNYYSK